MRVHRSGVNPTDWKTRTGSAPGTPVDPPQVPNQDGSGVVDAVGQGVEEALLGLPVWLWEAAHHGPEGTAQEYTLVPAQQTVLLPDDASFDPQNAVGFVAELEDVAGETLDRKILIHRPNDMALRLKQHLKVGIVGDRAARGKRS